MNYNTYGNEVMIEGTQFYQTNCRTVNLEWSIQHMDSFEQFEKFYSDELINENQLLPDYLHYLIDRYGSNPNRVAERIGWSRDYVRQIANGDKMNPDRDLLLAICVYLQTTVDEAQTLLKYSGHRPLYAREKRDAIIWFALKKHCSLLDLNAYLYENGYPILENAKRKKEKRE